MERGGLILAYNWQILDRLPEKVEELGELVKVPAAQEEELLELNEPSTSMHPTLIHSPRFHLIFAYCIEQPTRNPPILHLVPALCTDDSPLPLTVTRSAPLPHIQCLTITVQHHEIYDKLLELSVQIYQQPFNTQPPISNIKQLTQLAGDKQLAPHSRIPYRQFKQEIVLESPVIAQFRQEIGYIIARLIRTEEAPQKVEVREVQLMTWLAKGNSALACSSPTPLLPERFTLKAREVYSLAFRLGVKIGACEVPFSLEWRGVGEEWYKLVRWVKMET